MCGIVSVAPACARPQIEAAVSCLAHRGPDGSGVWSSSDGRVSLGHSRLSVIDTSSLGAQPMRSPDGKNLISFNGEIYNFRELGAELDQLGFRRQGGSDTEVLLAAWNAWGKACLDRIDGMFAFAIYDSAERKLFFARDRAGEKPLFYRHDGTGVALASELKALLVLRCEGQVSINVSALEHYLAWGYVAGADCLIEGYSKLPPGAVATYEIATNRLYVERYWAPPLPSSTSSTDDRIIEGLDAVLEASVRRQLVADVPVGVLLSGGLDSSLVAAYAAEARHGDLRTFTVAFPNAPNLDESMHAARVAAHLGTDHTEIALPEVSKQLFRRIIRQVDEPIADPSLLPTSALAQAVREHVTVAIGGDGGDELFGGYPRYTLLDRMEAWRRWLPGLIRGPAQSVAAWAPQGLRGFNAARSVLDPSGSIGRFNVFFGGRLRHSLAPGLFPAHDYVELARDGLAPSGLSAAERAARADFASYLPDEVLVKVDRASMLHSLEVRAPLLDRQVLDYAFGAVPWRLKAEAGARKIALRRLAARRLPSDFDAVRKQGFTPPIGRWLKGVLRSEVEDAIEHLSNSGFDGKTLRRLADHPEKHANRLFALVVLSGWMQTYRVYL